MLPEEECVPEINGRLFFCVCSSDTLVHTSSMKERLERGFCISAHLVCSASAGWLIASRCFSSRIRIMSDNLGSVSIWKKQHAGLHCMLLFYVRFQLSWRRENTLVQRSARLSIDMQFAIQETGLFFIWFHISVTSRLFSVRRWWSTEGETDEAFCILRQSQS